MKFKLSELKAQKARNQNKRITWPDIEAATGVPRNMLIAMNEGRAKQVRTTYLDALAKYFDVELSALAENEDVILPLPGVRSKRLI